MRCVTDRCACPCNHQWRIDLQRLTSHSCVSIIQSWVILSVIRLFFNKCNSFPPYPFLVTIDDDYYTCFFPDIERYALCYNLTHSTPGYAADPNNCAKYYVCEMIGDSPQHELFRMHLLGPERNWRVYRWTTRASKVYLSSPTRGSLHRVRIHEIVGHLMFRSRCWWFVRKAK